MFQRNVIQHLVANGLDTIAYVPHCQTGIPVHVVEEHPSFTIESVRKQVSAQLLKYVKYDSANDSEAKLFLENSLEPSLLEKLTMRIKTTDSFPVVFITLMYLNRSQSVHRYEAIKESIRKRKPSDYPGEDIPLMSEDHKIDAKELVKAGQYQHILTGSMLDGYLKAGPKDHNLYRHNLLSESQKLERALLDIGYMDRTAADVHMASEGLTYEDVSGLAEDNYRKLKDKGEWTPALSTVRDSKRPPAAFGNAALCMTKEQMETHISALVQQQLATSSSPAKPSNKCNKCGGSGHWARDPVCPLAGKKGNNRGKNAGNNNKPKGNKKEDTNWKKIAPGPGEPQQKVVNGKTWKYCAHCTRWSTTHGTDGHTGPKKELMGEPQANLFMFPHAWHVPSMETPLALWNVFQYLMCRALWNIPLLIIVSFLSFKLGAQWSVLKPLLAQIPPMLSFGWSAVYTAFSASWLNMFAPLLWASLLVFGTLPHHLQHQLLGYQSPQEFKPFRMTKPKYKQFIRSCRRKRRPKSFSNHRHTRHYGLATRKRRPLSQQHDRFSQEVFELSQYIDAFGKAISFRRVPREGDIWSALHEGDNWNDWKNKSCKKKTNSETWQDCGGHHGDDPNSTHPSAHCPRCKPKKYRNRPNGAWETSGHWNKYSRWTYYNPNKGASANDWSPHSEAFSSCNIRRQRMRRCNRRNTVYKPTIGNGIPMSQLKVLTSPIAATFFANGNVPPHLNNITERFKAATDPKQAIKEYQKLHRVRKNKVIWDSGASHSLSPCKRDFIGPIQPAPIGLRIKGIARGLHIAGVGYVRWSFIDKTGRLRTLKVPAYYVPSASVRHLSTTSLVQAYPLEQISQSSTLLTMIGTKDLLSRDNVRQDEATNSIEVAIDPATNLPHDRGPPLRSFQELDDDVACQIDILHRVAMLSAWKLQLVDVASTQYAPIHQFKEGIEFA